MTDLRADMVTVFVFRRGAGRVEFLQLRRADEPARGTWQPILGATRPGESAARAAMRELREETGLDAASPACLGLWSLDRVRPFYLGDRDCVMLSPTFAAEADAAWTPVLDPEHAALRWIPSADAGDAFLWPGHADSCREIVESLLKPGSACEPLLRVPRTP